MCFWHIFCSNYYFISHVYNFFLSEHSNSFRICYCCIGTQKFSHKINLSLSFVLFSIKKFFFCMSRHDTPSLQACLFLFKVHTEKKHDKISTTYPVQRTNSTLSPCLARIAVVADSNKLHGLSQ